jgi:hypothetical protein
MQTSEFLIKMLNMKQPVGYRRGSLVDKPHASPVSAHASHDSWTYRTLPV